MIDIITTNNGYYCNFEDEQCGQLQLLQLLLLYISKKKKINQN